MPLQVMISVEALRACITLERTVIVRCLWLSIDLLHMRGIPTVESIWHPMRHASDDRHLPVRAVHISRNGTR